jgi:hypothetical protein
MSMPIRRARIRPSARARRRCCVWSTRNGAALQLPRRPFDLRRARQAQLVVAPDQRDAGGDDEIVGVGREAVEAVLAAIVRHVAQSTTGRLQRPLAVRVGKRLAQSEDSGARQWLAVLTANRSGDHRSRHQTYDEPGAGLSIHQRDGRAGPAGPLRAISDADIARPGCVDRVAVGRQIAEHEPAVVIGDGREAEAGVRAGERHADATDRFVAEIVEDGAGD